MREACAEVGKTEAAEVVIVEVSVGRGGWVDFLGGVMKVVEKMPLLAHELVQDAEVVHASRELGGCGLLGAYYVGV